MSETVNNYSATDYSKTLFDRIYNLETNIINLQYNQSVQSSQTHLIKVRNGILSNAEDRTGQQRRLTR